MALDRNTKKTISHTFRIDSDAYDVMDGEAKTKDVSINTLLNQIVKEHIFKRNFDKIGSILMPKDVLREAFANADEVNLLEAAKTLGSTNFVEYVELLFQTVNKNTVLQFLDLWIRRFSSYEYKNDNNTHMFSITHDINGNYSMFAKELLHSFIQSTIKEPVKIQVYDRRITLSIASGNTTIS